LFIKFIEEERIVVLNLQKALTNHYITDIQIFYTNNNKKNSFLETIYRYREGKFVSI